MKNVLDSLYRNLKMRVYGLIGVAIFVYILSRIDFGEMFSVLGKTNIMFILLGIAVAFIPFIIRSVRWGFVIRYMTGKSIPLKYVVFYWMNSMIFGFVTPGRVGELLMRSKYVKNHAHISFGKSFSTAVFDRLSDIVLFVLVGITGSLYLILVIGNSMSEIIVFLAFLSFLVFMILLFIVSLRRRELLNRFLRIFFRRLVPDGMKEKVKVGYNDFFESLVGMNWRQVLVTMVFSVISFMAAILSYYFIAMGIGIGVGFWYLAIAVPITYIVTLLPVSISGLGTRELSYILLFSLVGISAEMSVMFSLSDMILLNWVVALLAFSLSHVLRTSFRMIRS
jgi:uncharacterized protein (TIRG00374 family)